ncbi:MAG: choice-of-anchor B family protein [Gemmatimonadota bacterium]|nr:choice-of-anchor B family protein [Gemmatimonadota bacterium]
MKPQTVVLALAGLALAATPVAAQSSTDSEEAFVAGFGGTVAISGGEVFVGEPGNVFRPGMIYVYQRGEAGDWVEAGVLMDEGNRSADRFGGSMVVDGRTMLASVNPRSDDPAGVVSFWKNDDGAWTLAGRLPHEPAEGDGFGAAVALAGDVAFVGAPGGEELAGVVYVYTWAEGGWAETAVLEIEDGAGTGFGGALAASGTDVLIGAPSAGEGAGAVYHFQLTEDGWTSAGQLPVNVVGEDPGAGSALAMSGNMAFVGVPRAAGGNGAVLVYEIDEEEGGWNQQTALLPFEGATNLEGRRARFGPRFGSSIATDGESVWVGTPGRNTVYTFHRGDSGWSVATINPEDAENSRGFGGAMAMAGDIGVIGASGASRGMGEATIFEHAGAGWTPVATVSSEPESLDPIVGADVRCEEGEADMWGCEGVDLVSFLPVSQIGGAPGIGLNDMWGWYDEETGKEYALVGRNDGTSFIDVTDPSYPIYLGDLPKTEQARISVWRDIKVYRNHAYIVSDGAGDHGMQVFDLTRLRGLTEPQMFEPDFLYTGIASSHNIVMNEETGFAYAVGASGGGETCGGGLHMIDVRNPKTPVFAGCFSDGVTGRRGTGYSHDAQCVSYIGPDPDYQGREICIGSNETALSFADVTDKENPVSISTVTYPNVAYTHQGWFSEDQTLFFSNDEGDEPQGLVETTRTLVWDVSDLDDPVLLTEYFATTTETDHNLYILDDLMYESNYGAGLRIIDISDPDNIHEVGFFDTDPDLGCCGSWSNYPYFRSGAIGVTGGRGGFFMVKKHEDMVM